MLSILEASRETIRTLILKFNVLLALGRFCQHLWDFRFLRLESLTIGVWHFKSESIGAAIYAPMFNQFLVAHGDTLVELDLAYNYAYNRLFRYSKVFGEKLRPASLPNLTTFRGHTNAFLEMVDARMECLRLLRTLEIGSGGEWDPSTSEFHEMFDGLDRWQEEEGRSAAAANEDGERDREGREPILRSLIHLRLELNWSLRRSTDTSTDEVLKVMERCAEHFGKTVEDWMGDIDFPIEKEEIFPVFEQFERLKHICLNPHAIESRVLDYVQELQARISTVEEVNLIDPVERQIQLEGCELMTESSR
jgi:hypothetical protein